jgi:type I restriction enzyme S subunit
MSKKNDLEHTSTTLGSQNMKSSQRMVSIVEPYELPEGWKWCRLGALFEVLNGYAFKSDNYVSNGIRVIRITNVQDGYVEDLKPCFYSMDALDTIKPYLLYENDLLISLTGNVGRIALMPKRYLPAALNQRVGCLRPTNSNVCKEFFSYFLRQPQFLNDCIKSSKGTAQLNMSTECLKMYAIPLPPTLAEQQRIVKRIESMFAKLDEAKEKAKNVVDGFETRKTAILHKAFTGELTARWRKENCVCDDSWEEKRFDSCIAKMQNGLSKRSGNEGEETVVLRLANMGEDDFDVSDLRTIKLTSKEKNNYSLAKNDVVMIRVNGSKTNVGRQLLVKNNKGWSFCDHIIRIQFEVFCLPNYMVYFSKTKEYIDYVQDNMVSSAGQNTISRKGLSNLSLKVPTLPEQVEIVRILDIIIEKENKAKQAAEVVLEQIDLLKKSILARAFRGEL